MADIISQEAAAAGVLPFSRFMELALYCPEHGFYERERDNVGREGDFYTSVSVGSLFGEMLAFQFAEWLGQAAGGVRLVETGAHDGKLARDILSWFRERSPMLFERMQYYIAEPSPRRRQWQRQTLAEFAGRVQWLGHITELPSCDVEAFTICFSNELLDAFPVHRLGWDAPARRWFEWGVRIENGGFAWAKGRDLDATDARRPNISKELLEVLPDGFTTEVCPAAEKWWRETAKVLGRGKLLTFDYGLVAEEFFLPGRQQGTLRSYHHHRLEPDVLANPGGQDITAQVNFTALQSAGEAAGLRTEHFVTQAKFLTEIARRIWAEGSGFGEWTSAQTRQFQTLTHPAHLGSSFRVLVQSCGD